MLRLLTLLALAASTTAYADDEASEHTAQLMGSDKDMLGVTVNFDEKAGWTMDIRAKPGADLKTVKLAQLPAHHAHYVAYVSPDRTAVTFIETSMGVTKQRMAISAKDPIAWTFSPDGKLLRSWQYGAVLTKAELAKGQRSTSHVSWSSDIKVDAKGLELTVESSGAKLRLDPAAKKWSR